MNCFKISFTTIVALFLLASQKCFAQEFSSPEIAQMYEQGKATMSRGNTTEAVAIFQKILPLEPNHFLVKKSLAQAYQLSGNHKNALIILDPLFVANSADAECYKIAAAAYLGDNDEKKAGKILNEGLQKNPTSGMLFYEQGLLFKQQKNYDDALKSWLDGIAADPNYHLNYHEAAIAYVQTDNVVWAIIYGEIFVNKEPNTKRANDTRILILDAYQKLFFTPSKNVSGERLLQQEASNFEEAVKKTYLGLFFVVSDGITTENLTMLRSRFMISWSDNYSSKYPFSLYQYHTQLITNGHFDVYNQWLFGKAESPENYKNWATTFESDMKLFEQFKARNPLLTNDIGSFNTNRNFKGMFDHLKTKPTKR